MTDRSTEELFTKSYWDKLTFDALELLRLLMESPAVDGDLRVRCASAILEITMPDNESF